MGSLDLSKQEQKPNASPQAFLRALGVVNFGEAIDWEALVRLGIVGQDVSFCAPIPNLPESGGQFTSPAAGAGTHANVEIMGGPAGSFVFVLDTSTAAAIQLIKFDSKADAEAFEAMVAPVVTGFAYSINGGTQATVITGNTGPSGGPLVLEAQLLILQASMRPRDGIWLRPGGVIRFVTNTANAIFTMQLVIVDPLAPP